MKKKLLFLIGVLLTIISAGCSNDNDEFSLCNTWILVSYVNESNEVLKEANGYIYKITFNSDSTYSGLAYGNEMGGKYKCKGNWIQFISRDITQKYVVGSDPDKFFLEHLSDVCLYTITDAELKLFYSKDQYFKFRTINSLK